MAGTRSQALHGGWSHPRALLKAACRPWSWRRRVRAQASEAERWIASSSGRGRAAPARSLERAPLSARLAPSRAAGARFKRSVLLLAAFFAGAEVCVGIITKTGQKYALDISGFLPSLLIRVPPVPGPSRRQDFPWGWRWPGGPSRTAVCRTEQGEEEWKQRPALAMEVPSAGVARAGGSMGRERLGSQVAVPRAAGAAQDRV